MYVPLSNCILGLRLFLPLSSIGCGCSFLSVCHYFALLVCLHFLLVYPQCDKLINSVSKNFNLSLTLEFDYLMINGRIVPSFVKWKSFPVSTSNPLYTDLPAVFKTFNWGFQMQIYS